MLTLAEDEPVKLSDGMDDDVLGPDTEGELPYTPLSALQVDVPV